ncbi:MAG: zinc ABC transporter substrate-binding protein [Akkermansiaceae bacterium]|nr:zinc ABC transporter substrate-binding protein [Akkermansiaceae bacterium]
MAKKITVVFLVVGVLIGGLVMMLKKEQESVTDGSPDEALLRVVTTTTMVTDMVKIIGGERVSVQGLMGAGVDPHSYQVSFKDTAALQKAHLIFYSGHHLEGKMQDVLEKRAEGKGGVYAITDAIDDAQLLKPQEQFQGYFDPHLWGNPEIWSECMDVVVEALSKADPEGADEYEMRAEMYYDELMALHAWVQKRVAEVPEDQRVLVTSHDAFFYFGKAYGFEVRGLQGISTNSESGLKDRAELVQFIKDRKLKMIFPESSVNAKGIKAVAAEAGVTVSEQELFSDAMGEPGDKVTLHGETYDKGSYIGMIKHNVNTIVDGLK